MPVYASDAQRDHGEHQIHLCKNRHYEGNDAQAPNMRRQLASAARGEAFMACSVMSQLAACGQWSVVSGQLLMVSCQLSVVSGQWSAVSGQLSAVSGQRSAVSGQWSAINGQLSAVSGQRSVVSCQLSVVSGQLLVSCQLSVVSGQRSP
jgi:hypothetical protein